MNKEVINFIQSNSPDGGFLQSEYWKNLQEGWGRKAHNISLSDDGGEFLAYANIIAHTLPLVGDYFYIPRGPILAQNAKLPPEARLAKGGKTQNHSAKLKTFFIDLFSLAKENNIGWIRIEPVSENVLSSIKENLPDGVKMKKSPVDMQPREILVTDISGSEEDILAQMKSKTRYNVKLAEKKNVRVFISSQKEYIDEFLRLIKITAERDKIKSHPVDYYRKMFEVIPGDIIKLYIAEYEGKIITANLVLFFGKTATYMHGASASVYRNVMAPYLLQWQAILDAKRAGCERYDFGGVKTKLHPNPLLIKERETSWDGITRFKTGFAPETKPIEFPGCYDIILNSKKYNLYRILQKMKRIF